MSGPRKIVEAIQNLQFERTFNPYTDQCEVYDRPESADLRAKILLTMLEAAEKTSVDAIWIGRDLGHKGGRRTGLALTDDLSFGRHLARWNINIDRPTSTCVKEQTATVIWEMLEHIKEAVFLWNVFPLHPYPIGDQLANRTHSAVERKAGERILFLICELISPNKIVAIGNDAAKCASRLWPEKKINKVRHPSYGGKKDFCNGIQNLYNIQVSERQPSLFSS